MATKKREVGTGYRTHVRHPRSAPRPPANQTKEPALIRVEIAGITLVLLSLNWKGWGGGWGRSSRRGVMVDYTTALGLGQGQKQLWRREGHQIQSYWSQVVTRASCASTGSFCRASRSSLPTWSPRASRRRWLRRDVPLQRMLD